MGPPKKTWQPLDYLTTRHDLDRLTNGDSTPLRHSSNPTPASSSRQAVIAEQAEHRASSALQIDQDVPEQRSPAAILLERHENQDPLGEKRSREARVVSSPPTLQSSVSDHSHFPILAQASSCATGSQRPLISVCPAGIVPKPLVTFPPQPQQTHTPGRFIRSLQRSTERLRRDFLFGSVCATTREAYVRRDSLSSWHQVRMPSSAVPSNPPILHTDPQTFARQDTLSGDVMASQPFRITSVDARRSNRLENRQPVSTVLCRNGPQCRKHIEGTCHYNHDFGSMAPNGFNTNTKKSLTVESPAFTPKSGNVQPAKTMVISPKAAAAATFTPRGSGTVTPAAAFTHTKVSSGDFVPSQITQPAPTFNEFVPTAFMGSPQLDDQSQISQQANPYVNDPFLAGQGFAGLDGAQPQINPYTQQGSAMGGPAFFQDSSSFKHPLNYHLYCSIGPRRENLAAFQRTTTDFFIPDDLREDLQRKSEAVLQTFANSTLPHTLEHFHSLVALDTNNVKVPNAFGYPTSIFKATSSKDGHVYALRRVEGFRLSTEASIRTINSWKRISNASMVQTHDAFTGRWFGDSSLIIVTDYHPKSQTLADKHFGVARTTQRPQIVPENELWGYIVQIASALKTIHEAKLAAQTVMASKVLLTSKNRLRLNGCGVFDIVQHEQSRPLHELQRADLQDLGRLILGIATRNQTAYQNPPKALELVGRSYTERLRSCIAWLIVPPQLPQDGSQASVVSPNSTDYTVNTLLTSIVDKAMAIMDSTLHLEDDLTRNLAGELENGRLVRLLAKLNVVLERPDVASTLAAANNPALLNQSSSTWSETGERYYLKLFRDYVFHQVDHEGRPVLDLGHIVTCLNKLDAGIDEKVQLMSRDEMNVFITSYKEIKRGFETSWAEISRASNSARR